MSKRNERDYIYLIWKDPKSGRRYIIGELSKNGYYEFSYGHEIDEAMKAGFELLISFDEIDKVYRSDKMFPTFASRLPDKKRRGIEKILSKYGLQEYDEYKLLKRSGARLPIDNLEFIDPILDEKEFKRIFYIAGTRHYLGCEGNDCEKLFGLKKGDEIKLELDLYNEYDPNAIKILDMKNNILGYVPRYYSESMTKLLKEGVKYKCKVYEINKNNNCDECIKVELEVYATNEK
ncbi:hiran domain family [Fervidicella metallireducens AeB]|uniref:Hiran domain family n=1 Tax=Fervidicella metallireducens AeB TaxID=1403537 RepID=A0A017RR96_9CLOT|nr:HIRAN domain-containing protein [Fervidicella metallireducens]EYE87162.1 hiran domain family [Fervidicella metallireducens AeB]